MERKTVIGAVAALLCLACSWGSDLIVANIAAGALTIRAQFKYDLVRGGILPIEFADANAIADEDAWHVAPAGAVRVDTNARTVELTLPPGIAARLGAARNCDRPTACDGYSFPLESLELSGSSGSPSADGDQLRAAFTRESRHRWVLWYPWTGAHGFWQNLRFTQAALLCLAIGVAVFALWTAVVVERTPMPRRWGWVVVALLGVGELTINWTTGETGAQLFSLRLSGASMARGGPLGPWVVALSFPLGALLALRHRHRVLANSRSAPVHARDDLGAPAQVDCSANPRPT